MIIYADILVVTNMLVNYFLLLIAAKLDKIQFKSLRIILSAFIGGISSLYILLQIDNTFIDFSVKTVLCFIMVLVAFGFKGFKCFIRSSFYLLAATFIFAGVMLLLGNVFKSKSIIVNNSTVYFDISAVMLIISAIVVYLVITVILFFTHKKAFKTQICDIKVEFGEYSADLKGFFDTGNYLSDNFSDNAVILVDKKSFISQNTKNAESIYKKRYRVLPCETVNGCSILEGFRADRMIIVLSGKKTEFINPLIMFSNTPIKDEYNAILNTEILNQVG